jgi:hypothetical protein
VDKKQIEQAAMVVVGAVDCIDDANDSIADAVREVFAGVSKKERPAVQTRFYTAIRAQYGADCSVSQLKELSDVGDLGAARILRAYAAARKAVSRLFPSGKTRKVRKVAERPSEGIAIPLTREGMRNWIAAAVAAIQEAEVLEFDAMRMVAALIAARDVL